VFPKNLQTFATPKHLQKFPHDEGIRRWGPHGQHIGYIKDGNREMFILNQK